MNAQSFAWAVSAIVLLLTCTDPAVAFDRADIPLKNWGGFAVYRNSIYDDLDRLVTAGFADRAALNTKPISRIQAARLVARAVAKIRADDTGEYTSRRDLEPVLTRLSREFAVELAQLGVRIGDSSRNAARNSPFVPLDHVEAWTGFASRDLSFINRQGLRFQEGINAGTTFDSRLQLGDVLSLYVQPELLGNEEYGAARLAAGYLKLTLFNVELLVGRESLWWGPGLHGSLILSNNARPLDQVRLGSAEPFLMPLVGQWLGPTKLVFFMAQLEEQRDHPRATFVGMRGTMTPFSFLELGVSRTVMFGGTDRPRLPLREYYRPIFDPPAGDDPSQPQLRSNNVFAIDADLRLRNVDRYHLPARDLRLYGEFGWDDTCCESNVIPLRDAISVLVGVQWLSLFGNEGLELRSEYARSSRLSFTHSRFTTGYRTRGEVISHFIGTEGEDYLVRLSNRVDEDLMIGVEFNRATIGRDARLFAGPKEHRVGGSIDISYRFWNRFSVMTQYGLMHTNNQGFRPGHDGFDHLLLTTIHRSFR